MFNSKIINLEERKRVLEIISDEITYKDGELNIKLKPIFQSLVENQYISALKNDSNRSAETGIIKGSEAPLDPQNAKNSSNCPRLELLFWIYMM